MAAMRLIAGSVRDEDRSPEPACPPKPWATLRTGLQVRQEGSEPAHPHQVSREVPPKPISWASRAARPALPWRRP